MTATGVQTSRPTQRLADWYHDLHPGYRLPLRWSLIGTLTTIAFHSTIASLVQVTRAAGLGGFVWAVVVVGALVAAGVSRWHRTELPIHDRQTDVIVGTMGLVLALLIHGVLMARYELYFHLLRLDLVAMWFFVLSASIVLFGLRPVARFAWVWGMILALTFPLPYYLTVIVLGGGKVAAGAAALLISAVGTGIALGRTYRRGLVGSLVSWAFGGVVLCVMAIYFTDAPLLAFQLIPAVSAMCVVGGGFFLIARRGRPKRLLDRKVEPLAARQVWAGVPVVVAVGIALSLVQLPPTVRVTPVASPTSGVLRMGQPLVVPAGWHGVSEHTYDWVHRMYGVGAALIRQKMTADIVNPLWDRLGQPRTVVVDSITSRRPFSFNVFPARVLYDVTGSRLSAPRTVELGSGVTGQMVSVVDDNLLVTWNALQFVWGDREMAQRVLVFAVDNHDPGAPFPEPSGGVIPTLGTLFTILLRGNAADSDRAPAFKDAEMLTAFGRALVAAQAISVVDSG
jgi:hypothetical protein